MPSVTVEIPERLAALMKGLPVEKMTYEAIVLDLYRRATISSCAWRSRGRCGHGSSLGTVFPLKLETA